MAVHLNGRLAIEDAFVDLGVPIELTSVEAIDLDLTHEGRGLRAARAARGSSIAGRSLTDASFGLTYVEPRLVIESLEGRFEGGVLRAIGGRSSKGANLFSIDLAEPFPLRAERGLRGRGHRGVPARRLRFGLREPRPHGPRPPPRG